MAKIKFLVVVLVFGLAGIVSAAGNSAQAASLNQSNNTTVFADECCVSGAACCESKHKVATFWEHKGLAVPLPSKNHADCCVKGKKQQLSQTTLSSSNQSSSNQAAESQSCCDGSSCSTAKTKHKQAGLSDDHVCCSGGSCCTGGSCCVSDEKSSQQANQQ